MVMKKYCRGGNSCGGGQVAVVVLMRIIGLGGGGDGGDSGGAGGGNVGGVCDSGVGRSWRW
jgi:hypothetical protein